LGLSEDVNAFIGLIYEAPYDAAAWDRMAHQLMALTHSNGLLISAVDTQQNIYDFARFYGIENGRFADGLAEYTAGMFVHDPSIHFAARNPNAGFCDSEIAIGSEGYLANEFIRWNREHFGSTHWIVGYTPPQGGLTFGVSLHTPPDEGHMRPEDEALFRLVFPHIARAVKLAVRPPRLSDNRVALVAINQAGGILDMNSRAHCLLSRGDALKIEDGHLVPCDEKSRDALSRIILDALATDIGTAVEGAMRIPRHNGRPGLLLAVEPLPKIETPVGALQAAAIVRIIDPCDHINANEVHALLFGLTERELQVADLLLAGHSIETVANLLAISPATVKIHVRALFRKTDTNRQSDLVELLLRVT
jgi:DNA-binding CsgD family transcriptional regulator